MAYTSEVLARRLQLSRELLSAYEPPKLTANLVDLRLSGPGRLLDIPFPDGFAPAPDSGVSASPTDALPRADVVVLTYTSDESKALADVLTPGRFAPDWTHYARGYSDYLPKIRNGAPARKAGRLGSYWKTTITKRDVLVFKSELHMHQDFHLVNGHPTLPIRDLFAQIVNEVKPSYFLLIGTAGGVYTNRPLGTIVASRAAQFLCEKDFKSEPFGASTYKSDWAIPRGKSGVALNLMGAYTDKLVVPAASNLATCPCKALQGAAAPAATLLFDGSDGVPAFHPVLTTDFFEFGTDKNDLGKSGVAVEMDDAVFGLACAEMAAPPKWASIRNYSDPTINGTLDAKLQESCASDIYMRYGYWTSVLGAIATWSVIADLP